MRPCLLSASNTSLCRSETHNGLVAQFGQRVVLTGYMPAEHGEALNKVQRFRQVADYSGDPVSLENANWAVEQAEAFVAAIRSLIERLGG